jgi:hypothetical protein
MALPAAKVDEDVLQPELYVSGSAGDLVAGVS